MTPYPDFLVSDGTRHLHTLSGTSVVDAFHALAVEYDVPAEDCLVTAYRYPTLPCISPQKPNTNPTTSLAWARTIAHSHGVTNDDLTRACAITVRILFGSQNPEETGWPGRSCHGRPADQCGSRCRGRASRTLRP